MTHSDSYRFASNVSACALQRALPPIAAIRPNWQANTCACCHAVRPCRASLELSACRRSVQLARIKSHIDANAICDFMDAGREQERRIFFIKILFIRRDNATLSVRGNPSTSVNLPRGVQGKSRNNGFFEEYL